MKKELLNKYINLLDIKEAEWKTEFKPRDYGDDIAKQFKNTLRNALRGMANRQQLLLSTTAIENFIDNAADKKWEWTVYYNATGHRIRYYTPGFMGAKLVEGRYNLFVKDREAFVEFDFLNENVKLQDEITINNETSPATIDNVNNAFVFPEEISRLIEVQDHLFYHIRNIPFINHSKIVYAGDKILGIVLFYGKLIAAIKYPFTKDLIADDGSIKAEYFFLKTRKLKNADLPSL